MSTMGNTAASGSTGAGSVGAGSSTTEQAKERVQDTAQQAAGQARGRLKEQVDQRSTQAGEQVSSTAGDMRTIAQQLREQGKDQPAKLAEQAADRAERLGDYLKQADGDKLLREVEDFGRRQPWAVMFGGLTAGFLASRFLKASSSRRYETGRQTPVRPATTTNGGAYDRAFPPAGGVPREGTGTGAATTPGRSYGEPVPGRAAEDVSLTGGVMPPGASIPRPGEPR